MAVEVIGLPGESNGHGDSMDAFRNAHRDNSRIILNLAAGRKKNAPTPAYDPEHADNAWPVLVYHPGKPAKAVGVNLTGLAGMIRKEAETANKAALTQAQREGFRLESYLKPQIAVLDPALEKAALIAKNAEFEGKIVAQADELLKLREAVEKLLNK